MADGGSRYIDRYMHIDVYTCTAIVGFGVWKYCYACYACMTKIAPLNRKTK